MHNTEVVLSLIKHINDETTQHFISQFHHIVPADFSLKYVDLQKKKFIKYEAIAVHNAYINDNWYVTAPYQVLSSYVMSYWSEKDTFFSLIHITIIMFLIY